MRALSIAALALAATAHASIPAYEAIEIARPLSTGGNSWLTPRWVDPDGYVAGHYTTADGGPIAGFTWHEGQLSLLPANPDFTNTYATWAGPNAHAYGRAQRPDGTYGIAQWLDGAVSQASHTGWDQLSVFTANQQGQSAGRWRTADQLGMFLIDQSGTISEAQLPNGTVEFTDAHTDLHGAVAAVSIDADRNFQPFLYDQGHLSLLPLPEGEIDHTRIHAAAGDRLIVGSTAPIAGANQTGVLWKPGPDGDITVERLPLPENSDLLHAAINADGTIVGTTHLDRGGLQSFIIHDGQHLDLESLVVSGLELDHFAATAISDTGLIVGTGQDALGPVAVLLRPIPQPPAPTLAALLALSIRPRRRTA